LRFALRAASYSELTWLCGDTLSDDGVVVTAAALGGLLVVFVAIWVVLAAGVGAPLWVFGGVCAVSIAGLAVRRAVGSDAAAADVWVRSFAAALPGVRRVHTDHEVRGYFREVVVPRFETWVAVGDGPAQRFYERHRFIAVERTDGSGNEEREPDIRYVWRPES
jgi:hypothetical protein